MCVSVYNSDGDVVVCVCVCSLQLCATTEILCDSCNTLISVTLSSAQSGPSPCAHLPGLLPGCVCVLSDSAASIRLLKPGVDSMEGA